MMSAPPQTEPLPELVKRQSATSAELTRCTTFREMAGGIARHMLTGNGQFVTISLAEYDETGEFARLRTVATANRQQAFETSEAIDLRKDALGYPLATTLDEARPVLVEDIEQNEQLSAGFREWLSGHHVRSVACLPMRYSGRTFGVVGISGTTGSLGFSAAELSIFQNIADLVSALAQVHHLVEETARSLDISERQAKAFEALTLKMGFEEMAATVAHYMLPTPGRFLSLSQFVYDLEGEIIGWQTLATANRERTFTWDQPDIMLDWSNTAADLRDSVHQGKPYVIADTSTLTPEFAGSEFYKLLENNGIQSFLNVPMVIDGRPVATLGVLGRTKIPFTREEINAFSNLADQMGTLIHTRALLEEAQSARDVAATLLSASRSISAAQNYEEAAQTIINLMPEAVKTAAIALFDRAVNPNETPYSLDMQVMANREEAVRLQGVGVIAADAPELAAALDHLRQGKLVQLQGTPILTPSSLPLLQAQGISHLAGLGLRSGEKLVGVLVLGSEHPLHTNQLQMDNLRVIADQLALLIENRRLVSQTADTLGFVQMQFETTSTIYGAKTPLEILSAIYEFAGGRYNHAHLALVEPENTPAMVQVVAELNYRQSSTPHRMARLDSYPAAETLSALETLYVANTAQDIFLTEEERSHLQQQDIGSLLLVPLVANQRLVGLITFLHPVPVHLAAHQLRAIRNLADQAAVVFENQGLLQSTEQSLAEIRSLYEVNRSILEAQDTLDILKALRKHLAPDALFVSHVVLQYDDQQHIQDMIADYVNTPTEDYSFEMSVADSIGRDNLSHLNTFWNTLNTAVTIMENLNDDDSDYPTAEYTKSNGTLSFVEILIRENGLVRETVTLSYGEPRQFDAGQRRLYTALSDQISIVLQNHRLLRDAQQNATRLTRQVRVQEAINALISTISTTTDEKTLLDHSARALVELMGIDHCGIVMVDASDTYGMVVSEYPEHGAVGAKLDMTHNALWEPMRQQIPEAVVVEDVEHDNRIEPDTRKVMQKLGIQSLAILPLAVNNKVIGGVGLDVYSAARPLQNDMIETARTIVSQMGVGLQNVRLLTDAQRRAEQLQRITSFSQSVQATLDINTIFNIALAESAQMLPQDQMSISLYDPISGQLHVMAQQPEGLSAAKPGKGDIIPITGHVARVWESWEPLNIPDLRALSSDADPGITVRSWMMCPILSRGRILGIASVGAVKAYAYTDTDVALFQQMVNQLAVALENAEVYTQSQRIAKNEALVNTISTQLQRQMDIQSMLNVTANELGKALGARQARIRLGTTPQTENPGQDET